MATQQSFLAKLGARLSTLGSAGSLAVAFPLSEGAELMSAHTDATRTGWYATMSAGAQSIHAVVGGQDGFSLTRRGTNVNGAFQGSVSIAPLPAVGTLPPILRVSGPGNSSLTASQEWNAVYFNLSDTTRFDTGPLVEQSAFRIEAPFYDFVTASVIATAATVTISGGPGAGGNATFTNAYALWIQSGALALGTKSSQMGALVFNNSSNNFSVTIQGSTAGPVANYTLTLPPAQGGASTLLSNDGSGVLSWVATPASTLTSTYVGFGSVGNLLTGSAKFTWSDANGSLAIAPAAQNAAAPTPMFTLTGAANTAIAAGGETNDLYFNLARAVEWATSVPTTQRAFLINAPTYACDTAAQTITTAATFAITGAPIPGTNCAITNSFGLWVQDGASQFGSATATNSQPLLIKSNAAAGTDVAVFNYNNGTNGSASFTAVNDAGKNIWIGVLGSGAAPYGVILADEATLYAPAAALNICSIGPIIRYTVGGGADAVDVRFTMSDTGAFTMGLDSTATGSAVFANAANAFTVTLTSGVTAASYSLTLPTAQGAASSVLSNDGSGVLSWAATAPSSLTATYVGYGSAGNVLTGSNKFTWTDTTGSLAIASGTVTASAAPLSISQTWNEGSTIFRGVDLDITNTASLTTSTLMRLRVDSSNRFDVMRTGGTAIRQAALTATSTYAFLVVGGAYTAATASSEITDISFLLARNVQWATSVPALQRAINITAPTYACDTAAQTITTAATVAISGAPIPGTNCTITHSYALWIPSGNVHLGPVVAVDSGALLEATYDTPTKNNGLNVTMFSDSYNANYGGRRARGTLAAPTAVQAADVLSSYGAVGYGTTGFATSGRAKLQLVAAETWTDSAQGAYINFFTTAVGGTSTVECARFSASGNFRVGVPNTKTGQVTFCNSGTAFNITIQADTTTPASYTLTLPPAQGEASSVLSNNGTGILSWATTAPASLTSTQVGFGSVGNLLTGSAALTYVPAGVGFSYTQAAQNGGGASAIMTLTGGAHTTKDAATEITDIYFNLTRTVQLNAGATLADMRAFRIGSPTYTFTGASAITDADTIEIIGPPVAGANATISEACGLSIASRAVATGGGVVTTAFGLKVASPTGATTNFAALFTANTTTPTALAGTVVQVVGADAAVARVGISSFGTGVQSVFSGRSARGTAAAPTASQADDALAAFTGWGYGASAFASTARGGLFLKASQNWSNTVQGTYLAIETTLNGGTTTVERVRFQNDGGVSFAQAVVTATAPNPFLFTAGAHTALPTGTEVNDVRFGLNRTAQFATGAITTQRAFLIAAPTYAFVGASTITTAATLAISGAPAAGTNATITNSYALWVQSGAARLDQGTITTAKTALQINATWNAGAVFFTGAEVAITDTASTLGSFILNTSCNGTSILAARRYGVSITQVGESSGVDLSNKPTLNVANGAHTNLTAGTEFNAVRFLFTNQVGWATGAITTQRAFLVTAPSYAFAAASTITTAATLAVADAPAAGTNATITNALALWVQAGATSIQGLGAGTATAAISTVLDKSNFYFTFTGSTAAQTITLPAANLYGSTRTQMLVIRNKSSVVVAISRAGADTIDGGTTINLPAGASVFLFSNGASAWDSN